MRYLKYLLMFLVAAAAVALAIANRAPVTLHLLPEGVTSNGLLSGASNELVLPVYIVVMAAIFGGVVLGMVLEMLRETGHRRQERRYKREAAALMKENQRLRALAGEVEDDLLGPA